MKRYIVLFLSLTVFLLSGCDFNTAGNLNLYDKKIVSAIFHPTDAYYLDDQGTLYSPGADSDASCYVIYQNQKEGVVAEHVVDFETFCFGGYYVTEKNELYIWSRDKIDWCNYSKPRTFYKIADSVSWAKVTDDYMIYIDQTGELYLAGEFEGESRTITNPKLLAENVLLADLNQDFIVWVLSDGTVNGYGSKFQAKFSEISKHLPQNFDSLQMKGVSVCKRHMVFLVGKELWYYGDYSSLLNQNNNLQNSKQTFVLLAENIIDFSVSDTTIAAIDENGNGYLWGKCFLTGSENQTKAIFQYLEKQFILSGVRKVSVSGDYAVVFITDEGKTNIFHQGETYGWAGNSVKPSTIVGINSEPVKWVKKGR